MIRYTLPLFALAACASADLPGDDGGQQVKLEDALVATVVLDASPASAVDGGAVPPPPLPDAGAPADAGEAMGCAPGDRLGLCSVCGPAGTPVVPQTDAECPPVDCGDAASFTRTQEAPGIEVCTALAPQLRADVDRCLRAGVCQNDPAVLCGEPAAEEVARTEDACQEMIGCAGATPPEVQPAPAGAQCNTFGTCQAGACSVSAECAAFSGPNTARFCQQGQDGANAYCEFVVDGPGDRYSCDEFCQEFGTFCLAAFGDHNDTCEYEGGVGCDERLNDQICRCVVP